MSAFLVNLARRSAGLAPVVPARSTPAAIAIDVPSETPIQAAAPPDSPPAPVIVTMAGAAPVAAVDLPQHAASAAPIAVTSAPAAIVQRELITAAVAPASPVPSAVHLADAREVAPRSSTVIEPAARVRAVAHALPPRAPEPDIAPQPRERLIPAIVPASVPAISFTADDTPEQVIVSIQPADAVAHANPVLHSEPTLERTVHVRIGAIEIYGPESGAGAQSLAATVPAAVAATTSHVPPAGGFDDYAALRSYAPWTW